LNASVAEALWLGEEESLTAMLMLNGQYGLVTLPLSTPVVLSSVTPAGSVEAVHVSGAVPFCAESWTENGALS
jgi:hypothetical protein